MWRLDIWWFNDKVHKYCCVDSNAYDIWLDTFIFINCVKVEENIKHLETIRDHGIWLISRIICQIN
jgi:hypothetical protein